MAMMEGTSESPGAGWGSSGPGQGVCALHTEVAAAATCSRCGNYACAECTEWGRYDTCPTCRQRLGIDQFPFTRDGWTVGGLLSHAWETFKRDWGPLVGVATVLLFVPMTVNFATIPIGMALVSHPSAYMAFSVVNQIFQMFVTLSLTLGAIGVVLASVRGRAVEVASFVDGVRNVGKGMVQYLLLGMTLVLVVGLPAGIIIAVLRDHPEAMLLALGGVMLVLVVPLFYVFLGFVFIQYELVNDPACGPVEAIFRSWALAKDQRLGILGTTLVSVLIVFSGAMVCCIGLLAAYPVGLLLMAGLYLALRNGSDLPDPAPRSRW